MDILHKKAWLCAVCFSNVITESRIEHTCDPSAVPDVGGCDYSTYTDHKVTGGKLFEKRVDIPWDKFPEPKYFVGGICNCCLKTNTIVLLLPNITFAEESAE